MQGAFTHMFLKMWIYSINKAALRKIRYSAACQYVCKKFARTKDDIRRTFIVLYRVSNIKQFVMDDYSAIDELLQEIKKQSEDELDKIQKLQYQWFIENLTDILQRLE